MGKHKTKVDRIRNTKTRLLTFYKRKKGLLKKAMELSAMCDVHILLWIFNSNMKRWAEFTTLPFNNLVQIHDSIPSKDISLFSPLIKLDGKGVCKTITPTELISEEDKKFRVNELSSKFNQIYKNIPVEGSRTLKNKFLSDCVSTDKLVLKDYSSWKDSNSISSENKSDNNRMNFYFKGFSEGNNLINSNEEESKENEVSFDSRDKWKGQTKFHKKSMLYQYELN